MGRKERSRSAGMLVWPCWIGRGSREGRGTGDVVGGCWREGGSACGVRDRLLWYAGLQLRDEVEVGGIDLRKTRKREGEGRGSMLATPLWRNRFWIESFCSGCGRVWFRRGVA